MSDCIFCKIVNGEIPCYKVYEDAEVLAFLDISQTTKGHTLVIPKEHFDNIYDIDPEVLGKAVQVGQKVIKHATKVLGCQGYNLLQNNGEVGGQTVFHFHMHLIPRYEDMDNSEMLKCKAREVGGEELKEIAEAMRIEE